MVANRSEPSMVSQEESTNQLKKRQNLEFRSQFDQIGRLNAEQQ